MRKPNSFGFLVVRGDPPESFLLMKHPKRWDLPKGHIEPGESEVECALRELTEETGITSDDIELDTGFRFSLTYPVQLKRYGNEKCEKTTTIFLARLIRDVEIVVTEHEGYKWFRWSPPHTIQAETIDPCLKAFEAYLSD